MGTGRQDLRRQHVAGARRRLGALAHGAVDSGQDQLGPETVELEIEPRVGGVARRRRLPRRRHGLGLGAGLAPKAPGTFGTLVAVPLYLLMIGLPLAWYLTILIGLSLIGIWASS